MILFNDMENEGINKIIYGNTNILTRLNLKSELQSYIYYTIDRGMKAPRRQWDNKNVDIFVF